MPRPICSAAALGRLRGVVIWFSVGLVLLAACADQPWPASSPSVSAAPSPRSSGAAWPPTPEPTAATASPDPTEPIDDPLTSSALYDVAPDPRACPLPVERPRPALPDAELQPYVRSVVRCLTSMYAEPLGAAGITLRDVSVRVYRGRIETDCGTLTQRSSPAYYCPESATIYWPVTGDEQNDAFSYARLGYVSLAAHEFGHHLQAAGGILGAYATERAGAPVKRRNELTRRLELQAQCIEGVTLAAQSDAIGLTARDRRELRLWHEATGDEDPPASRVPDHGTSADQIHWLFRGLDSGDLSRCDTWGA